MKPTLIAAVVLAATSIVPSSAAAHPRDTHWSAAWTTAMQRPTPGDGNWSTTGFDDQTIRQTIRLSAGGRSLRIRLSDQYGTKPIHLAGVTVAGRTVTFEGSRRTTIAPGRTITSDAVKLATDAGEQLAVSLHVDGSTGPATFHEDGLTTTYATGTDETSHSIYYLAGVDVTGAKGTVVTFGDSITNGHNSTVGADHRYSDYLATPRVTADQLIAGHRRLIAAAHARGVRIVGGTILPFKADYMKPADFARAEAIRTQVNTWIRTSGQYDAVADFALAVGDPADEQRLDPALDSGDHLHPNDAGYAALAVAAAKAVTRS